MNKSDDYLIGFNQAADDYQERKSADVTERSEDYQEGYQEGWEHNATLSHSDYIHEECDICHNGHFRPCHICGAS